MKKTAVQVIDEIHEKVDTASGKVLAEAMKIIGTATDDEKMQLLEKVAASGFPNAKEVVEAKKKLEDVKLAREKAKWILHYQTHYPHKYILVEDMRAICKEYHLLLGSDKDYIDSIPEKNQRDIVNFKLREEDRIYYKGVIRTTLQTAAKGEGVIDWEEIDKDSYNKQTNDGKNKETGILRHNKKYFISNDDYFSIAATPNMFDLKGKVIEGIDIKKKVEWDDPIVLKAVKYGYIVVSVWGQELAIEKMRNEKMN